MSIDQGQRAPAIRYDDRGHAIPPTEAERRARSEALRRGLAELASIPDDPPGPILKERTMSTASNTLHVLPAGSGEWAIRISETAGSSSIHATQALAVAKAWELVSDLVEAEVIVHSPDGRILSTLTIRSGTPDLDEAEDAALRAEAVRITPSNERLRAMIGKFPLPPGDYDDEELPC